MTPCESADCGGAGRDRVIPACRAASLARGLQRLFGRHRPRSRRGGPMKVVVSLTAVCAVSLLGAAAAQQPESSTQEEAREGIPVTQHQQEALRDIGTDALQRLDADGDGSVSRQEAESEPSLSQRWDEYDRNADQVLEDRKS